MRNITYTIAQGLIFALILFLFTLVSCGSRKVQKSQIKEETKIEVAEETKTETKTETKNDIIVISENDEITIEPIDTIKPMIVNGKTYKNARIKHKKNVVKAIDKTIVNVAKNEAKVLEIKKQDYKETNTKNTERKASYYWLLWFLLLIPIYWLWRNKFKFFGL